MQDVLLGLTNTVITYISANPRSATYIAGAIGVVLVAVFFRSFMPFTKDPVRLFTPEQKKIIHGRAGRRCEHVSTLMRRCSKPGTQADHVYPWSKGGPTAISNGASLCRFHNASKGAKIPSFWYIKRLELSRKSYFPGHEVVKVKWRRGEAI